MKKRFIIIIVLSTLLIALGFSYAYFKTRIEGSGTPISAKSKQLKLIFTDDMRLTGTNIEPGWSESKTFSVKNEGSSTYKYNIIFKDLINTFVTEGYLQYKITSTNGYNMTDYVDIPKSNAAKDTVLASEIEIDKDVTQVYTIEFIYKTTEEDQSDDMGKTLSGTLAIMDATYPTTYALLVNEIKKSYPKPDGESDYTERTDFSVIDNGDPALYKGVDDDGPTYYFSGDGSSMNNWVSFAGSMWRIIRINGSGSVRLLYAGDGTDATDIGSSAFNSTYNNPMYVGWKYGDSGSLENNRTNGNKSTIYGVVESWYNGLGSTNQNYIDTGAIYCNDRNLASGSTYSTSSTFYYAGRERLNTNKAPIFTCSNTSDIFGASQSGNNKTIPVGLMTADEVTYAGGLMYTNSPKAYYYLAKDGASSITGSSYWWTMSPSYWSGSDYAYVISVGGSGTPGYLSIDWVNYSGVVRPVVSLKSNTLVSGSGTASDPYVVQGLG